MGESDPRAEGHGESSTGAAGTPAVEGAVDSSEGTDARTVVSRAFLASAFSEFAEEVNALEADLADAIPGGEPAGIHRSLSKVGEGLASGARTMRTHPAINVYARLADAPLSADLMRALVAFDAKVNAVDDVIDTEGLTRRERTYLMTVVGFSDQFMLEQLPPEHVAEVASILRRYAVELSQIPSVERRMGERIRAATTRAGRFDAAASIYAYRARDMKAFAEVPAVVTELGSEAVDRAVVDLCAFRARYLLFEDFRHVERDRSAGHENPIMVLAGAGADREELVAIVRGLLDRFSYSPWAEGRYAAVLRGLERRPDDVPGTIEAALGALAR